MAYNKSPLTMTDLAVILDDGHRDGPICGVTSRNDSGSEYFRLCRCYRPNNAPDKLLPGQAGFTVPLSLRDELLAALANHRQTLALTYHD